MTIWNLGSINADFIYRVPHLPAPGETLAATSMVRELGGKGANQSVAAARAGARVVHLGAIGQDGDWALQDLSAMGVETGMVARLEETATGHAMVFVDPDGENSIVLHPGANRAIGAARATDWMAQAEPGDMLLLQNETDASAQAAKTARDHGVHVVYSAAPFEVEAARSVLPWVDTLILNAVEARQLAESTGQDVEDLDVAEVLITRGAEGATLFQKATGQTINVPAPKVTPVDTTGAGDTFAGWFCGRRDAGDPVEAALSEAAQAAAIQVTRPGTAAAIPQRSEVTSTG